MSLIDTRLFYVSHLKLHWFVAVLGSMRKVHGYLNRVLLMGS